MSLLALVAGSAPIAGALASEGAPGAPQYGAWGFDVAGQDKSTSPGDDFFRFTNGAWLDANAIPPDKPGVSLRLAMTDRTEARLHDMLEAAAAAESNPPSDLAGKAGAFYKAFLDEARIEKLGAQPIRPAIDAVRAMKSRLALAADMGRTNADFEGTLFNLTIDVDLKDPKRYAVYLSQGGLGLPDRDYYLESGFAREKAAYTKYVAQLLVLEGWPDAQASARAVVAFETEVAKASWTKVQQRDAVATYNAMTVAELGKHAPAFPWKDFLADAGLKDVSWVVVAEKSAFPRIASIYAKTPLKTLAAWQAFHIADNAAPYLAKPFADAYFEMHDRTLEGQKEQKVRWKRAVYVVSGGDFEVGDRFGTFGTMGWGVGQMYTDKYFPPESKAKIEALVLNVKAAYRARLEAIDWMSASTKAEALRKLDTYTIKVGYPDHLRDYSRLRIRDDDIVGDVRRAAVDDWNFTTGRLFSAVDRSDWGMTPQTNDAYNGNLRDIVFPAGILQAPMFDPNADPAINYGAIGAVIGHELTHGFDDEGRKIDADGVLRDWWAKDDAARYEARAKVLGGQYSKYEAIPGARVNGDLTMGENIADLGGVTLGLDAYHASLGGQAAPVVDGLSGDQRVFLGWAQVWRGKVTDDHVRKQVVSDPHSPRQFRVNGVVRNIDAWYVAFGVKPGDRLYVAPEERARIW